MDILKEDEHVVSGISKLSKEERSKLLLKKCIGKKTFYDEERCFKLAKKIKKESKILLRPYKCPFCNLFHFTKKNAEKYWDSLKSK